MSLEELVVAMRRTTKMKRAPAGAKSTGLNEGAFVPELTGFRLEMPGGSSLVNIKIGEKLDEEVLFDPKQLAPIAKALSTYLGKENIVRIAISRKTIEFHCGASRIRIARKL